MKEILKESVNNRISLDETSCSQFSEVIWLVKIKSAPKLMKNHAFLRIGALINPIKYT